AVALAVMYWLLAAALSAALNASSLTVLSRTLATWVPASRAMVSRGVHCASARRAAGAAKGPCLEKISCSIPADGLSLLSYPPGTFKPPTEPAAMSTTSTDPSLSRCWTVPAARGHTTIRLVTGLVAHQRSLVTSTTDPSERTESILYGPDDGNHRGLMPGFKSHIEFHASAIRATTGASLFCRAEVTSTPNKSASTCDGIIVVAVNSCE